MACLGALGALLWQTALTSPQQLWVPGVMAGLAFAIEASYRALAGREIRLPRVEALVEKLEEEFETRLSLNEGGKK